jgi:hypothetical protein
MPMKIAMAGKKTLLWSLTTIEKKSFVMGRG